MSEKRQRFPGGSAKWPSQIPLRGYGQIAKRLYRRINENQLSLIAAGIAFFGLLALFPALSALVAVSGLLLDQATISSQMEQMLATMPPAAADLLRGQVEALMASGRDSLGLALLVSVALALFSARRGTLNLMAGLNVAYEETESRGILALQVTSLVLTLAMIVGIVAVVVIAAALPIAAALVAGESAGTQIALVLRWPLLILVAIAGFALLYRFAPARRAAKWRWITPGATLAVVVWIAATVGFTWYAQSFGSYNETFGALAGVIVLMLWLYLSAFSVLLGALIDAELEGQTAEDSTIGGEQPMGERGAVKADRWEGIRSS